jgi:RNA polymerase sigma-B factor
VRTQEPFDDLYQVACLGLVHAVDRFDPTRGLTFTSFAVPTILGQLKRHFRDKGWAIHLPRGLQELVLKVQAADEKLGSRLERSPTVPEIAEYLECSAEAVVEALDALRARRAGSLDEPLETESEATGDSRYDVVGAEDEAYDLIDLRTSIKTAIERLATEDRRILSLHQDEHLTQRQIAGRLGVSQMQVSRILSRIRREMRADLELERAPDCPER